MDVVGGFAAPNEAEAFVEQARARIGPKHGEDDTAFLIAGLGDQPSTDGCAEAAVLVFQRDAERVQLNVLWMLNCS